MTPHYKQIVLEIPTQHRPCCSCPDHRTNYVGVAYKSYRLRLVDANGLPFRSSGESCTVNLAGVRPSAAAGDATLAFARNGEIHRQYDKTVLGVSIRGGAVDLEVCNALNANFGYPMTVSTNLAASAAPDMKLVTDVKLSGGHVHLELSDATAPFAVWYHDLRTGNFRKLLDTASTPVKDLSMAYWKVLMKRAVDGNSNEMPIFITSPAPGKVKLKFRYWNVVGGRFVQDEAVQAVTSVKPPLLADYNWDFSADAKDALDQANGRTNYFWTNHDTWTGDDAFAPYSEGFHMWPMTLPDNSDDMVVNGRNDLVNLCPFAVDLSGFVSAWGTTRVQYVFYTGSPGNVRFVPVRTKWNKLDGIVKEGQKTVSGEDLHSSELLVTSIEGGKESGYVLPPEFLSLGASGAGALAVEFVTEGLHTLRIAVKDNASGDVLFDSPVSVRALDVHDMYRWLNLESACGADAGPKYAERLSVLWPDSEHADANVVFVHGYNVHPTEAWDWAQAMFKRLRWSGMDAGFTAVLWRGNESQWWIPKIPLMENSNAYATRNYHQNVLNAFRTAYAFTTNVNTKVPGAKKYMIAHSLGNMLVSAARQFHGLQYERYFMLNAAVPIEAYDAAGAVTEESKLAMTPSAWRPYPDRVRSSHWYELFLGTPGDARQGLTWKGLFKDVDNTVNFYSSQDEVVANGNGKWKWPLTREYAWYNQERARGSYLVSFSPQAGWEFSDHYVKEEDEGILNGVQTYSYRKYTPEETFSIADTNLMVRPFFKDFSDGRIYGEGGSAFLQANDMVRWYALSHGIPAESFSAGANPVPKWGEKRNIDMAIDCNPKVRGTTLGSSEGQTHGSEIQAVNWVHSYFIGNSLFDTQLLYMELVKRINPRKPMKGQ